MRQIDPTTFRSLRSINNRLLVEGADCPPDDILEAIANSEELRDFCDAENLPFTSIYKFLTELGESFRNANKACSRTRY